VIVFLLYLTTSRIKRKIEKEEEGKKIKRQEGRRQRQRPNSNKSTFPTPPTSSVLAFKISHDPNSRRFRASACASARHQYLSVLRRHRKRKAVRHVIQELIPK
jgi:hypothetical protein